MNAILGFTGFVSSLLVYLLVARKAGKFPITHPDQFFLSKSQHDDSQFASSQIGYALQMATVYPFFTFAFSHLWWLAIWNTVFYALGIVLLAVSVQKFIKGQYQLVGSSRTLHAFIGNLHGAPKLRQFSAWMSLIGFTGLTAFEIVWGARILRVLFNDNSSIYYFTIGILGFYLILYLWLGGQRGAINTGQYQLVIAYVGIHAAVAWAVLQPMVSLSTLEAAILVPVILISCVLMLVWRVRSIRHWRLSLEAKVSSIITVASLVGMMVALLFTKNLFSLDAFKWQPIQVTPDLVWQAAAFALLPIFFQFVDMTNWQRMASLADSSDEGLLKHVRIGLTQYLIESPLSWLLPVLLGSCAMFILDVNTSPELAWDAFIARIIAQPGIQGALLSVAVVSGVASVFLSTADGLLSAIGYSFTYDIQKRSRNMIDRHTAANWSERDVTYLVSQGRGAMAAFLTIVIIVFVVADIGSSKGETVLGLFLAFYTPMVAFAPAILAPAVTGRVAPRLAAWLSIGVGGLVGIGCGVVSIFLGGIWQWIAPIATFAFSWVFYLGGLPFGSRIKLPEVKRG